MTNIQVYKTKHNSEGEVIDIDSSQDDSVVILEEDQQPKSKKKKKKDDSVIILEVGVDFIFKFIYFCNVMVEVVF